MATFLQEDFGGGIYRGRRAPANGVFDAMNALVDDEGNLFRRGGSSFKSNANTAQNLVGLFDGYLSAGLRTLTWPNAASEAYYLGSDDATPATLATGSKIDPFARGAVVAGTVWLPCSNAGDGLLAWGGARKPTADVTFGTVGVTNGSPTMTSTGGTAWTTKYEPGSIVYFATGGVVTGFYTIQSVDSNTQITLTAPYAGTSGPADAVLANFSQGIGPSSVGNVVPQFVAASGASPRLWVTSKNRAYYSAPNQPAIGYTNNYIELPAASQIIGADNLGDTLILFTTDGVWAVGNTELDPVDDYGNPQWQQNRISRSIVLWGDPGIAAWQGALVVPAVDDVYLLSADGTVRPISGNRYRSDGGIRPLYRSYVKAGYQPGTAAVHRGHLFLPVVNGTTLVDVLVCRLDRGSAWTRWSGHATGLAYQQRIGASTRSPKLLSINAKRVIDLTTALDVTGSANDADATTPTFTVESNDVDLGPGIRPDTAEKVRYVYETAGGTPAIAVSHAVGAEGASYTAGTLKRGGGASDGTDWSAWRVGRKAERMRFRFTTSSAVTSLILRRMEITVRQAGQT